EDVDLAQGVDGGLDEAAGTLDRRHVGDDRDGPLDGRGRRLDALAVAAADGNPHALGGERPGRRQPEPGRGARDRGGASGDPQVHGRTLLRAGTGPVRDRGPRAGEGVWTIRHRGSTSRSKARGRRSGRRPAWWARGDLNPHVLSDTGT